jgi:hypothetical protein
MTEMTAEELAAALGAKRSGRQWVCKCVAHKDSSPSMIIFDGREHVQVRCLAGCEPEAIIAVLRQCGLWNEAMTDESTKLLERSRKDDDRKREHRMRLLARGLFDEAVPIRGSLAELYFESRDLADVARMVDDIRFHGTCPRYSGENYRVQPAVIVAMRSATTNTITGIQRIFLTKQGKKDGKGMMLGSISGAAMKLQHLQDSKLHICEGLEDGLALIAMDKGPVWALGSASNVQNFGVIASVSDLYIWADHDNFIDASRDTGRKAAAICEERWIRAGKNVATYQARKVKDQCDVWRERNGRL